VSETATQKELTKAYRKLARENHPDAKPDDKAAEDRFKEISAAYDVLGDEAKRKEYDEVRRMGPVGGMFGGGGPGGPRGGSFTFNMGEAGLGDLLGDMFSGGRASGRRGGAASRGAGPQRGQDLEAELNLAFDDAVRGITTTLHLTSDAVCSTCSGSGAKPGSSPRVCPVCGGRGVTDDNQGFFSFSTPCANCRGQGVVIDDPCPTCRGTGIEHRPREVKVRIPAGVSDGQRIRLKGRGGPGRNGGPAGDLFVTCRVQPHPLFGRDGDNLVLRLPVTFAEAVLGATIRVPVLDGTKVTLKLRPGTQPGQKYRVKGRGVVTDKHTGDLIVIADLVVPSHPSAEETQLIEELAKISSVSPRAYLEV
jgi:molecular chaperone DnaJ